MFYFNLTQISLCEMTQEDDSEQNYSELETFGAILAKNMALTSSFSGLPDTWMTPLEQFVGFSFTFEYMAMTGFHCIGIGRNSFPV